MTNGKFIFGIILVVVGISVLTGFSLFQFALGAVLMWIGVRMLYGKGGGWSVSSDVPRSTSAENMPSEVFVFSPVNKKFQAESFKGGKIVMVFAGGEIDLSQARTSEKEVVVEVIAVFGGAKLIIPKNWKIVSEGAAIFGGYDNRTEPGTDDVTLRLKGSIVFGGIEIING